MTCLLHLRDVLLLYDNFIICRTDLWEPSDSSINSFGVAAPQAGQA
jgi:hypothetical protein